MDHQYGPKYSGPLLTYASKNESISESTESLNISAPQAVKAIGRSNPGYGDRITHAGYPGKFSAYDSMEAITSASMSGLY